MYKKLLKYWIWLLVYVFFTGFLYILMNLGENNQNIQEILITRGVFCIFLALALGVSSIKNEKYKNYLQFLLAYSSLSFLYKDTAILNTLFFDKIDDYLIKIDDFLFNCQPSLWFSENFGWSWFSELMFLGYFFYYLFPIFLSLYILKFKSEKLMEFANILIISFVIYYGIFIILPAEGPQFYFQYPENHIKSQGIFADIVKLIQKNGEAPTAAFPSSHIGISVILLLWIHKTEKKLLKIFILPVLVLCFSTVYIKAHYAVDVIFGFISAGIIYKAINKA